MGASRSRRAWAAFVLAAWLLALLPLCPSLQALPPPPPTFFLPTAQLSAASLTPCQLTAGLSLELSHLLTALPACPARLPACLSSPCLPADILVPGLMPGQIASPVRLGRARQGIFSPMLPELTGLDAERIVQVGAGNNLLWV